MAIVSGFGNFESCPVMFFLTAASAIENYALPKIYRKVYYCISAAIHSKVVRFRFVKDTPAALAASSRSRTDPMPPSCMHGCMLRIYKTAAHACIMAHHAAVGVRLASYG